MTREFSGDKAETEKLMKVVELSTLFDFYGELLKDHKKQIFEDYIWNDLSLSEIAEQQGISRQGVYDIVKRCSKDLMEYEKKLKLVEKFEMTKQFVNQIKKISSSIECELSSNQQTTKSQLLEQEQSEQIKCLQDIKEIETISEKILEIF